MRQACTWSLPSTSRTKAQCSYRCPRCVARPLLAQGLGCKAAGHVPLPGSPQAREHQEGMSSPPRSSSRLSSQILATPSGGDIAASVCNKLSARVDLTDVTLYLPTLKHGKIAT